MRGKTMLGVASLAVLAIARVHHRHCLSGETDLD